MKLPSLFLFLCIVIVTWAHSATGQKHPIYPYKCFISIKNTKLKKGYLYQITDSTILITKKEKHLFLVDSLPGLLESIPLDNRLFDIRLRSRFSGAMGASLGFFAGIGAIAIIFPNLPDDFQTQLIAAVVIAPITAVGLSAIGARVANATSIARYKHANRNFAELEKLRYYSFLNWLDKKAPVTQRIRNTRDARDTQD